MLKVWVHEDTGEVLRWESDPPPPNYGLCLLSCAFCGDLDRIVKPKPEYGAPNIWTGQRAILRYEWDRDELDAWGAKHIPHIIEATKDWKTPPLKLNYVKGETIECK